MTPVRVLLATLLCSCFALGQNPSTSKSDLVADGVSSSPAPWQIAAPRAPQDPLTRMQNGTVLLPEKNGGDPWTNLREHPDRVVITIEDPRNDTTCYAIRSYVVARDDKDSDSTHPVRYSTCQPATRYRLRTTVQGTRQGR